MAFINKMDILGADFYNAVGLSEQDGEKNAIVLQLPIVKKMISGNHIDLMGKHIYNDDKGNDITITDIPEDMKKMMLSFYHTEMVEKICGVRRRAYDDVS